MSHRAIRGRAKAAPSPGGEGWDEGERETFSAVGRVSPLRAERPQTKAGAQPASAGRPCQPPGGFFNATCQAAGNGRERGLQPASTHSLPAKSSASISASLKILFNNPGPIVSAGRNRHDRSATIGMLQEMVAAPDAQDDETGAAQSRNHLTPAESSQAWHLQMASRCTPTNSVVDPPPLSTSRHNSMASRIRSMSLSSERACV